MRKRMRLRIGCLLLIGLLSGSGSVQAAGGAPKENGANAQSRTFGLYVESVLADGNEVYRKGEKVVLHSDVYRMTIKLCSAQPLTDEVKVSCILKGIDPYALEIDPDEWDPVSYTNLPGGTYEYRVRVHSSKTGECLWEMALPVVKNDSFWEESRVVLLIRCLQLLCMGILMILFGEYQKRKVDKKYKQQYLQQKNEELARMVDKDPVTGCYNRSLFEKEKLKLKPGDATAIVVVSINHIEYLQKQYGNLQAESITLEGVQVLQEHVSKETKIYRATEKIFCFWLTEEVELTLFVDTVKKEFAQRGDEKTPHSFAMGAVYVNRQKKESMDELLERCEKMRTLDEKHAEAKFMAGKIEWLENV